MQAGLFCLKGFYKEVILFEDAQIISYFRQVTMKFLAFFIGKATHYTFWFVRMEYDLR